MSLLAEGSPGRLIDSLGVAAAALASIALVQFVTGSLTVTLAFAGGLVVLGLIAFAAARGNPAARTAEAPTMPDWSVTVTVLKAGSSACVNQRRMVPGEAGSVLPTAGRAWSRKACALAGEAARARRASAVRRRRTISTRRSASRGFSGRDHRGRNGDERRRRESNESGDDRVCPYGATQDIGEGKTGKK